MSTLSVKAQRLLNEDRMCPISPGDPGCSWLGTAEGDTGEHFVCVADPSLRGYDVPCASCSCKAWMASRWCSHVEAAVVLMVESDTSSGASPSAAGVGPREATSTHSSCNDATSPSQPHPRAVTSDPSGDGAHQLQKDGPTAPEPSPVGDGLSVRFNGFKARWFVVNADGHNVAAGHEHRWQAARELEDIREDAYFRSVAR